LLIVFNYTSLPADVLGRNLSQLTFSFAFASWHNTAEMLSATRRTEIFLIFFNWALIHSLRVLFFVLVAQRFSYANEVSKTKQKRVRC
jgi:hypothetical protein